MDSHCFKRSLVFVAVMAASATIMTAPKAKAQLLGPITSLLGLVRVDGIVYCTPDGNAGATASPAFPNAAMQLRCGGAVISTSVTGTSGSFSIMLDPLQILLSNLLSNCQLTVTTPPSTCNPGLPSNGVLSSSLQSAGSTIVGLLTVTQLIPTGFRLIVSH